MKKILLLFVAFLFWAPAIFAKQIVIDDQHVIDAGTSSSTITGPDNSIEVISKRTSSSKHFQVAPGRFVAELFGAVPIHYRDKEEWKDVDPGYYEDKGDHLLFTKMPIEVKVWKNKTGYEVRDKKTNEVMSVELLEVDNSPVALSAAKMGNVDVRYVVSAAGVRLWKDTKVGGPKKFKWKILVDGDNSKYKFREVPEAYETDDKEKKVKVVTKKDVIPGGFEWTEEVPKTGVTVDTDFTAGTDDGQVQGVDAVYATARSTAFDQSDLPDDIRLGQRNSSAIYRVWRGYVRFDTSSIGYGSTITQVNLKMTLVAEQADDGDWDMEIVKFDWTTPLSDALEANYDGCLAGAADDNIFRNTAGAVIETPYTSGNLSTAWPDKSGYTGYGVRSSKDVAATAPSDNTLDRVTLASASHATAAWRPTLIIAYTPGWSGQFMGQDVSEIMGYVPSEFMGY